jgi:hypothetical protein
LAAYKACQVTKELQKIDTKSKTFDLDSKKILNKYNRFQAAEYNAIVARSRSAKQFMQFQEQADVYPNMEWIMTRSADPREEHLIYVGTVLPIDDPFWSSNQPGDLWNCKCDWQQTDKPSTGTPKGTVTPSKGLEGNPVETGELITDKHPYIANAQKNVITELKAINYLDSNSNLKINVLADKTEIADNVATGRILTNVYKDIELKIREHIIKPGIKNPEFELNGLLADAKRIKDYDGIKNGFKSAIKQGCQAVIIDFNKNMSAKKLNLNSIIKHLKWRHKDFEKGLIKECYLIQNNRVVKIIEVSDKEETMKLLEKLKP